MKKLITKKDFILLVVVLVVGLAGVVLANSADKGKTATIKLDGEKAETVLLTDEGFEKNINGVLICIENGEIYVKESICSDKVCLRSGKISKAGEGIICAPNRVSVEIDGEKSDLPDALTG